MCNFAFFFRGNERDSTEVIFLRINKRQRIFAFNAQFNARSALFDEQKNSFVKFSRSSIYLFATFIIEAFLTESKKSIEEIMLG